MTSNIDIYFVVAFNQKLAKIGKYAKIPLLWEINFSLHSAGSGAWIFFPVKMIR